MIARDIVNRLLESDQFERVCAWCQKERGIASTENQSHGHCRRHSIEYLDELLRLANAEGESQSYINTIQQEIEKTKVAPEEQFAPEMT